MMIFSHQFVFLHVDFPTNIRPFVSIYLPTVRSAHYLISPHLHHFTGGPCLHIIYYFVVDRYYSKPQLPPILLFSHPAHITQPTSRPTYVYSNACPPVVFLMYWFYCCLQVLFFICLWILCVVCCVCWNARVLWLAICISSSRSKSV